MEWNEQTHHKIQAYIDNELTIEAQEAFETEMESNPDLAREVILSQDLQELLADTPENALRKNLHRLSEQVTEEDRDKTATIRWWLWGILLLLIIGIGWLFYTKTNENQSLKAIDNIQIPPLGEPENNIDTNVKNEFDIVPTSSKEEKEPSEINSNTPQKEEKNKSKVKSSISPIVPTPPANEPSDTIVQEPKIYAEANVSFLGEEASVSSPLIASNFRPNSELDFLISNNLRDSEIGFEIEKLTTEIDISSIFEAMTFQFAGKLTAEENLLAKKFKIHIFSNDKAQFQQFLPLFSDDLRLEQLSPQTYSFHFTKHYLLSSGLYYFLVENAETERVYFVEKFLVELE